MQIVAHIRRYGLLGLCMLAFPQPVQAQPAGTPDVTFIYLHGFGGIKPKPRFCINLRKFLKDKTLTNTVVNYEWDSTKLDVLKGGASWRAAEARADEEALMFRTEVLDVYESQKKPYALVAFSIGTRVVLGALDAGTNRLEMLRGVYFLGSAVTHDTTITAQRLPDGLRITNYHSPTWDVVHHTAFSFMNSEDAGGSIGFSDTNIFENLQVSSTHMHKEVGVPLDYSQLAIGIGYRALFLDGIRLKGKTRLNIKSSVGEGDLWWNQIMRLPGPSKATNDVYLIEQHAINDSYFRAVHYRPDGKRKRVARGKNMHAILKKIGAP